MNVPVPSSQIGGAVGRFPRFRDTTPGGWRASSRPGGSDGLLGRSVRVHLAAAGELDRLAPPAAPCAAFRLPLPFAVGDEGAPPPRFLQDAVSLDHLVEATEQGLATFVGFARDEEQTGLLNLEHERAGRLRSGP